MKERPIIFNDEMVRAILEGRKTQTRRVVKSRDVPIIGGVQRVLGPHSDGYFDFVLSDQTGSLYRCPYGQVGDRLWVRETFHTDGENVIYRATCGHNLTPKKWEHWQPSIYMARWASRSTLEITGIRVERVQQISDDDALAEGVWGDEAPYDQPTATMCFETLWDSINTGDKSWEANPWVWVIEFRKVEDK